jgi:glutamate---cysteine ligase / carboxylate-amine ligase
MSFRMTLFSSLPRTGLPERFSSYAELKRNLDMLVRNGMIEHAGKMWWDVRPDSLHPALETRVMDTCTSIEDAVSLAAMIVALTRRLYRMKLENRSWRIYPNMLIAENRWRAMRYSIDAELLDLARGELVAFPQLVKELIELVRVDAQALGCLPELEHIKTILERGTSAHRQIRAFEEARKAGASAREALQAVVDFLIRETKANLAVKA